MLGFDCISRNPISYEQFGVLVPDLAGLVFYQTGAATVGASQLEQSNSLGGNRSSTFANRVGVIETTAIPNLEIIDSSHQVGTGSLVPLGGISVAYTGPNATQGNSVTPTVGVPVMVTDSLGQWVLVNQTTSDSMLGQTTAQFLDQFNNVYGGNNATVAGETTYRAVMLNNDAAHPFFNITLSVGAIATSTCTLPLPTTGAGTIWGTFDNWPWFGFCAASSGETFYFSSRTNTSLTVPALGRNLFSTSGLGNIGDTLTAIPPIQLALETPTSSAVQTVANETTSPTGLTFGSSVNIPVAWSGQQFGLWIKRFLPAGMTAAPYFQNVIALTYDLNSTAYSDELVGLYRVSNSALEQYEISWAENGPPNLNNAPNVTFTGTSYTTGTTFSDGTYYFSFNQRNTFNLVTQDTDWDIIPISSGVIVNPPPTAPTFTVAANNNGSFTVQMFYFFLSDAVPADTFLVYFDTNNTNPLLQSPVSVAMRNLGPYFYATYTTSTFTQPSTLTVVVQSFRSKDSGQSSNTATATATSEVTAFGTPPLKGFIGPGQQMN